MTRDELMKRLDDTLMLSSPRIVPEDLAPDIDAYVAAERERHAQAIEAQAAEMQDGRLLGRDRGAEARSYLAAGMRMAATTVRQDERHD